MHMRLKMFGGRTSREEFLATTRRNRNNRQTDSRKDDAARVIQRCVRNNSGKRMVFKMLRQNVDGTIGLSGPVTAIDLFHAGQKLLFVYNQDHDTARFNSFCQSLLDSMDKPQTKAWYVTVALNKKFAVSWIRQMKTILNMACNSLKGLKPEIPTDMKRVNLFLNVMILFTDYSLWKFTAKAGEAMKPTLHILCVKLAEHLIQNGFFVVMNMALPLLSLCEETWSGFYKDLLCNSLLSVKPKLPGYCLAAAMGIRQLALCQFPSWMLKQFVFHVLSVPASMLHLHTLAPDSTKQLQKVSFVCHILNVLHSDSSLLSGLKPNESLSVFGNLVYLSSIHVQAIIEQKSMDKLVEVVILLIGNCDPITEPHKSSSTMWHPFFGSTKAGFDRRTLEALVHVRKQLQLLWSGPLVDCLFSPILALTPATVELPSSKGKFRFSLFKKSANSISVGNSVLQIASRVCWMYSLCVKALTQLSVDFLIGLGCHGSLVPKTWHFVWLVVGLNVDKLVQTISADGTTHPISPILLFACQVTQHLVITLDDEELFTQEKYFSLSELREISLFLNQLTYSMIMGSLSATGSLSGLFSHCHSLLTLLYSRDARRSFVDPDHWLIRSLKISTFMAELKARKQRALDLLGHIPHVIPHKKRLEIFHQQVTEEKEKLGIKNSRSDRHPATYITIHRAKILEDGYAQLSLLHMKALKGTIRVKFVNEQGLEEAGIDEMGVFKEFLEEVITKAFDPALNLFQANSVGHLYPSPSSHIHENYLSLFEFVGKMLGKAVYEGIVVDVPFAPFFLSQMLGHHYTTSYSCLDELPSMDPELYKSLSYVKHTEDDVADLCLSFSWDEDFMGKVVSHELVPGGCGISVTNENRISYVHRTAYFRMYTQLKKQSAAFIRGFHSLIDKQWIAIFSPNELQRLISGDHVDLDIDDLRKHTRYYGGYHDKHKVVVWLWDILKNDFKKEEKAAFLKFVTSCSKPPLLGFSTLEPQFSIRCVEIADEQDEGDSIGSMLRGFFSVRHQGARDRLPTASTCFNLLKLPNYTRKAVLREKLRYAVTSNAGFELS